MNGASITIPNIGYYVLLITVFFSLLYFCSPYEVLAQNKTQNTSTESVIADDSWISKRDNLNVTMKVKPQVPIIDEWTLIDVELRHLDSNGIVNGNISVNATITDHDGRLFKFPEKTIQSGKISLEYIFPDDGQHRIILQLYNNSRAINVASFDLNVPHSQPSNDFLSWLFQPRPY